LSQLVGTQYPLKHCSFAGHPNSPWHGEAQIPFTHDVPTGHGGGESTTPSQLLSIPSQISIPGFTAPTQLNTPFLHSSFPGLSYGDTGSSQSCPIFGSFAEQQFGICVYPHVPPGPEQWSDVQLSLSLQSPSTLQHPACLTFEHVLVATLHLSSVQRSWSAQSASVLQHPGIEPPTQKPPGTGHVAFEHALPCWQS
jgi:hypothetical protein